MKKRGLEEEEEGGWRKREERRTESDGRSLRSGKDVRVKTVIALV